jgi:hypothetical protein
MSTQPQGPGWWQASDGRWYPPQPPQAAPYQQYTQQPAPAPRTRNRGCVVAVVVAVAFVLIGGGIGAYYVYRGVTAVTEVAGGAWPFGEAKCPAEQDVSSIVGSPVTLVASGNVVVAKGCSYFAVDKSTGADVQITTGAALVADEQFQSFASDAATQGATPEAIPVGERAEAFGGSGRSGAIAVVDSSLILVEVFNSGSTDIGDKKQEAITLLEQVIAAR